MTSANDSFPPRTPAVPSRPPAGRGKGWAIRLALVLAAFVAVAVLRPRAKPVAVELRGFTMGTHYTVRLAQLPPGMVSEEIQTRIEASLATVNRQMSTYLPDSELSRFNRWESEDWFPVSPATAKVVAAAQEISRQTDGAFDVTVGPLVNLWSFGPDARPDAPPTEDEIERARARVGYRRVEVRPKPPALRKSDPDVYVDLSAIAKGYAVDVLESHDKTGHCPRSLVVKHLSGSSSQPSKNGVKLSTGTNYHQCRNSARLNWKKSGTFFEGPDSAE